MKTCTKCGALKPATVEFFYQDKCKSDGLHSWCIGCQKSASKVSRDADPQLHRDRCKHYRSISGRTYDLRKNYGITEKIYDAMFNAQGGVCAICGAPPNSAAKGRLAVDHDHATKRNRGLLCTMCNHALERVENDPDWGTKALNYLSRYIEQTVAQAKEN